MCVRMRESKREFERVGVRESKGLFGKRRREYDTELVWNRFRQVRFIE